MLHTVLLSHLRVRLSITCLRPLFFLCLSLNAAAQIPNTVDIERQQQAAREALLKTQTRQPNANAGNAANATSTEPKSSRNIPTWLAFTPPETVTQPCFTIHTIEWQSGNSTNTQYEFFDWLKAQAKPLIYRCVDAAALRGLQDHLGQSLVQAGYITTRVLIPEQNLSTGQLKVTVIPGVIAAVNPTTTTMGAVAMLLPRRVGNLLNQRDLDQALESARRLPSQDRFEIDIAPGVLQGQSILQIKSPAVDKDSGEKRWRGNMSIDDSGSTGTGNRYQLGGTFSYDSPLGLYDGVTLSLGSNSNFGVHDKHNRSRSLQWNMPLAYAILSININDSQYLQTVAGYGGPVVYSGRSTGLEAGLNYTFYRDSDSKDSLAFKINRKASRSYLEDTEIDVQFKDTTGYELAYNRRQTIGQSTLELSLGQRGNFKRYSNHPGILVGTPDWSGHTRIHTGTLQWSVPFRWQLWNPQGDGLQQKSQFQSQIKWHQAQTAVQNSDYFALGGRYSIRGTDGQMSLASDRGWLIRNDLSWTVPNTQTQLYLTYDLGHLSGHNIPNLIGDRLFGTAVGYKGKALGWSFDLSYGLSARGPKGFKNAAHALTAQMSYDF